MPGLVGFTCGGLPPEEARRPLERMRALLSHAESRHHDELFCDGRVCATRTHTNIIQKGPQPHSAGGVHVWLDGEFYNREELARSLGDGDAPPNDPALLLRLYGRGGGDFDFLKRVDGIYSAVVYDAAAGRVHLVSDRYGLRHLFWAEHAGGIAWGSEAKAMLGLPGFEPRVDREALSDFIRFGHLTGDRTLFEGVELLPSGTVLTWDERARSLGRRRYWWWDEIKPLEDGVDEDELARELGRLFRAAVERHSRAGGRVGLTLSGGLDSRAILAAMPGGGEGVHAISFGKRDCYDVRVAARVARVTGATHHVAELDAGNWLTPRLEGVWFTDGQLNLMHMHVISVAPLARRLFDVSLDGFLGGAVAGDGYIGSDAVWNLDNRGRRFISLGPAVLRPFVEARLPFFDNRFLELTLAAPERLRGGYYLYRKMLLLTFPELFRDIPWQNTGAPIRWPRPGENRWKRFADVRDGLLAKLRWYGLAGPPARAYADYANWMRQEPARSLLGELLLGTSALHAEYVPREQVGAVMASHMKGRDRSEELCRFLTFEIWLRQVFLGEYRAAEAESLEPAIAG